MFMSQHKSGRLLSLDVKRPVTFMYTNFKKESIKKQARALKVEFLVDKPITYKQLKTVLKRNSLIKVDNEEDEEARV